MTAEEMFEQFKEKQIPMKPKLETDELGFSHARCPICGEELNSEMDYCYNCYQKIDCSEK